MGFKKIFWGFLFLFDFRINGIDILPDFVGYILIYLGLDLLVKRSSHFQKAKNLTIPLILISIFDIYQIQAPIGSVFSNRYGIPIFLFGLIFTILNLIMVFNLCMGIYELARGENDSYLQETALNRWKLYLAFNILFMFFLFIGLAVPGFLAMLVIVLFIFSIVVYILMMQLMRLAEERLKVP